MTNLKTERIRPEIIGEKNHRNSSAVYMLLILRRLEAIMRLSGWNACCTIEQTPLFVATHYYVKVDSSLITSVVVLRKRSEHKHTNEPELSFLDCINRILSCCSRVQRIPGERAYCVCVLPDTEIRQWAKIR